ncbi:MAG: BamA/TamA family outer membrane protein [Vicinamibacterales bacterium]
MSGTLTPHIPAARSPFDRALGLFADVRAGEGATAVLMLVNVFLLLVCYSVIKTIREPLILLGGGAEVRSYAAAGQALLLMAFVPLYGRFAARVDRVRLVVGVTLFFLACVELFAGAVAARVPFVGVAFFIWVGIFNMSLVAQFWSFANDIYRKDAGDRLFPLIMLGMTGGAPLGSIVAARLFRAGLSPQAILQISAVLLALSAALYLAINRRVTHVAAEAAEPLDATGGFALVLANPYLRLVALLVILLNIVNTTGEYIVAKLLTAHVAELAASIPNFDKRAFIGAFAGEYQFWVNVTALLLQAFVTSRLVKHRGLQGALLALPLIALGGYAFIAAGAGFAVVRWIKTAENATDYSIMNTARQLLWLPTTRDEKYKAKQAIDTFCVRMGDVVSAGVVFIGTGVLHLAPNQFAVANVVLTLAWLGVAALILRPRLSRPSLSMPRFAGAGATAAVLLVLAAQPADAQESRARQLADARAEKAANLTEYEPTTLERRVDFVNRHVMTPRTFSPFIGSVMEGGGLAVGPAVKAPFGDSGLFSAHAAWSIRNYGVVTGTVVLPEFASRRLQLTLTGERLHAPTVAFFGVGADSAKDDRRTFGYDTSEVGGTLSSRLGRALALDASVHYMATSVDAGEPTASLALQSMAPAYVRAGLSASLDSRSAPGYSRDGGLLRGSFADYHQANGAGVSFRRVDAEAQRYLPVNGESQVIAMRALTSATFTSGGNDVPYFMLPELGGHGLLRGYSSLRYRDRSRLLVTAEYRWTAGPLVDMSLFADGGTVAPSFADLASSRMKTSYGAGITLHTPGTSIARLELAKSSEGLGLLLSFGPGF